MLNNINNCLKCDLCLSRYKVSLPNGNIQSKVMIILDKPNLTESKHGKIGLGRNRQILLELLLKANLNYDNIYLTSLIKCYSDRNEIYNSEIQKCITYLLEEIKTIKPIIIITSGKLLNKLLYSKPIKEIHGKPIVRNKSFYIPLYDMSYIMMNPLVKLETLNDIEAILEIYRIYINPLHQSNF